MAINKRENVKTLNRYIYILYKLYIFYDSILLLFKYRVLLIFSQTLYFYLHL